MKEQKVVITDYAQMVNDYLNNGWIVVSVTATHQTTHKYFCFVLEKQK